MLTIEVKPWADVQGASVTINACDFDPALHERMDGDDTPLPSKYDGLTRQQLLDKTFEGVRDYLNTLSDSDLRDNLDHKDRSLAQLASDEAAALAEQQAAADAHARAGEAAAGETTATAEAPVTIAAFEGPDSVSDDGSGVSLPEFIGADDVASPNHPPGDADVDGLAREDKTADELRAAITAAGGSFLARDDKKTLQAKLAEALQPVDPES